MPAFTGGASELSAPPEAEPPDDAADAPVRLFPLIYMEEGGEVTVGRADIDSYAILPPDGAALLRQLELGMRPTDAAAWYRAEYGEGVDVADFLEGIAELGFIRPPGDLGAADQAPAAVRWQRLGRIVFSPPVALAWLVLVGAWVVAAVRSPDLVPTNHDVFFCSSLTLIELVGFVGQIPLVLLHEACHALAARKLGLRSSLSVGRRFYYIVFQTTINGLVGVPRRKRYLPMLAGILCDLAVISAFCLIAGANRSADGGFDLAGRICLASAYISALRMFWQFAFFLETDVYFLVTTMLGCVDLQRTARQMLRARFARALPSLRRPVDPDSWHPRDQAVARWYSWLMIFGYVSSTAVAVCIAPVAFHAASLLLSRLAHPSRYSAGAVADSVTFTVLSAAQIILLAVVTWRGRQAARRTGAPQPVSS